MAKFQQPKLEGFLLEEFIKTFNYFKDYRAKKEKLWKLIDSFDNGDFWEKVKGKLPAHQITPDTNYIHYVIENIVNSIYAGNYKATILSKNPEDNEYVGELNAFNEALFDKIGMKELYPKLGNNVLKTNLSGIQVGWDNEVVTDGGVEVIGHVVVKHLPTMQIFLDPSITNYIDGRAIFLHKRTSIFDLMAEPLLSEGAKAYYELMKDKGFPSSQTQQVSSIQPVEHNETSRTVNLLEGYYKVPEGNGFRIDQVFVVDDKFIIAYKKGIKPNRFPIRILYGEAPETDPYGTPFLKKILSNYTALNMLDSIEATHAYLSQNRPKIVNAKSGINYRQFTQLGNAPHMVFPVNGNPSEVIQYIDQQPLPQLQNLKARLQDSIFLVTGIDPRYTGRDTGSIQTTGGTDMSQQRIISMTDNLRINQLEIFIESLNQLIIDNYIEMGDKYPSYIRDGLGNTKEIKTIDFTNIKENPFDYSMTASPYLPKNTMRLAESANELMTLQGQYGFNPPIITHEEWLMYQDFPQKETILKRLRQQQVQNDEQELVGDLMSFASMIQQGLDPQEAITLILEEKQAKRDDPTMGTSPIQNPMI